MGTKPHNMSTGKLQTTRLENSKSSNYSWLWKSLWETPSHTSPQGRKNSATLLLAQHGRQRTASATPSSTEKEKSKSTIWTGVRAGKDTAAKSNTFRMLEQSTILSTNEPCWFYDLHSEVYQGITSRLHPIYKYSTQTSKELWQY